MSFAETLRALMAKATPGPWSLDSTLRMIFGQAFDGAWKSIAGRVRGGTPAQADANAKVIVYLANHAEAIAAVIEAADRCPHQSGELAEALRKLERSENEMILNVMKLTPKQKRVRSIVEYLQNYINTYDDDQPGYLDYEDVTIIKDVLYGLGVALDKEYSGPNGYELFKERLRVMLAEREKG